MITQITSEQIPTEAFCDPYLHIVPLSLLHKKRPETQFFQGPNNTYAAYQPDTGFCYSNPDAHHILEWTQWLKDQQIRLLAGEHEAHYKLLESFSQLASDDLNEPQVFYRYEAQDFCIHTQSLPPEPKTPLKIKRASLKDLNRLFFFYEQSEYMQIPKHNLHYVIEANRLFYLQKMGKIVSAALTHCESDTTALIGGVYTPKAHRGKGFGYTCMWELMKSLQESNKNACLFYEKNNQAAKNLYQKMGYQAYATWALIELSYQTP